jgi:hypothetical protein
MLRMAALDRTYSSLFFLLYSFSRVTFVKGGHTVYLVLRLHWNGKLHNTDVFSLTLDSLWPRVRRHCRLPNSEMLLRNYRQPVWFRDMNLMSFMPAVTYNRSVLWTCGGGGCRTALAVRLTVNFGIQGSYSDVEGLSLLRCVCCVFG